MSDKPKLTARQQQIFELIQRSVSRTGSAPTRAEIAEEMGYRSANAAEEHLQALARKGVIELLGSTSRGIRLKADTLRAINQTRSQTRKQTGNLLQEANRFGSMLTSTLPGLEQLCLPLIGRVAAGNPILAQESIERTFNVEPSMFAQRPDFLLRVKGMSMRDAGILDGDLLAVAKTSEARNGQIVVARLDDEVTVKRFCRTAQGIELLPENPDFDPIVVTPDSGPFAIEGLAVGLIRNSC